ncbi:hypothetical protein GCM10023196_018970 [Actinoallomurus vinaceus]|uniref:Uncharacterized protein n=1 Tax=Actinoallomurus vinaceus TaxID=1080074 RepID=A0ABP8U737_9ACTN
MGALRSAAEIRLSVPRSVFVVAGWKREDVTTKTVTPGFGRQGSRFVDDDLRAPPTDREPVDGVTGQPVIGCVTEQASVLKDDEQRVCGAAHHRGGFGGARVRIEFPEDAARGRKEMVGVGNREIAPQPKGQGHSVNERVVPDRAVIARHADTIRELAAEAPRSAHS